MDQAGIIRDLLTWLEGHLDQPLSLDNVAAKAGYSKWHLQRMFKDVTGHAIGAYIRARRLSKSAVALRLTARPILDIALQYRFDSQQTFTRAFKKQFSQTPALYRRSPEWSAFGIRPPMRLGEFAMPEHQFVTLEDTQLLGRAIPVRWSKSPIFDTKCAYSSGKTFSARRQRFLRCSTALTKRAPAWRKMTNRRCSTPPRYRKNMPTGMCHQRSLLPYRAANM